MLEKTVVLLVALVQLVDQVALRVLEKTVILLVALVQLVD